MDHMWCGSECAVAKTPVPALQKLMLTAQLARTSLHAPCVHLALSGNARSWANKYLSVFPRGLILQVSTVTVQFPVCSCCPGNLEGTESAQALPRVDPKCWHFYLFLSFLCPVALLYFTVSKTLARLHDW